VTITLLWIAVGTLAVLLLALVAWGVRSAAAGIGEDHGPPRPAWRWLEGYHDPDKRPGGSHATQDRAQARRQQAPR
jgi:hypothetical protein